MSEQPPPGYGYPAPPPPPPVPGGPRPGELVDRFLARLIDFVGLGIVYFIVGLIISPLFLHGFIYSRGELFLYNLVTSIIDVVIFLGYYAFMESTRGQTVGKMVMKLKTLGPDGVSNPTMEQAIRRNIWLATPLLAIVPILGSVVGGVLGLIAMILIAVGINSDTVSRQAWHDHFAGGTRVLKIG